MSKLSPAAQAVWDAYNDVCERVGVFEDYGDALAAALRAAANQPYEVPPWYRGDDYWTYRNGVDAERNQLRAIAAELDGTQPSSEND